jgi:Xaa-Pro aminopeptidase
MPMPGRAQVGDDAMSEIIPKLSITRGKYCDRLENLEFHVQSRHREHTLSLHRGDLTELRPGMTIHVMPGPHFGDWGFQITESIVSIENGSECLSNVLREMLTID